MNIRNFYLDTPAARLECSSLEPDNPKAVAVIAHPHSLYGGDMDNNVVIDLARSFADNGYTAVRMNFRGVGNSTGTYTGGPGEAEDVVALVKKVRSENPGKPVVLAGYSFGTHVLSIAYTLLKQEGEEPAGMLFVATAAGMFDIGDVLPGTVAIHGDADTMIDPADAKAWADTKGVTLTMVPGADHFFGGYSSVIRSTVNDFVRTVTP